MRYIKIILTVFLVTAFACLEVHGAESPNQRDFNEEKFFVYIGTYGEEHYPQLEYYYYSTDIKGTNFKHRKTFYKGKLDTKPEYGDIFITDAEADTQKDPTTLSTYELAKDTKLTKVGNCASLFDKKEMTVKTNSYDGHPMEPHFSCFTLILDDGSKEDKYYSQDYFATNTDISLGAAESGDKILFTYYKDSAILPLELPRSTGAAETQKTENDNVFNTVLSIVNDLFTYIHHK